MRFMGLLTADKDSTVALPSSKDLLENMGKFMEEVTKAGVQLMCDGLQPSPLGARVKLSAGKVTVTGGPFPETKVQVAPCAMFDVDSILEAVQWATSLLQVLGEGECEIRPLCEA
jgi:hypothetical protein